MHVHTNEIGSDHLNIMNGLRGEGSIGIHENKSNYGKRNQRGKENSNDYLYTTHDFSAGLLYLQLATR